MRSTPAPGRRGAARERWLLVALSAVLVSCAPSQDLVRNGNAMIEQGRTEEGLAQLEQAAALDPGNREYRMILIRQREIQEGRLLAQADAALALGRLDEADDSYRRAGTIVPDQPRVRTGLDAVRTARRQQLRIDQANALVAQGRRAEASRILREVLLESPTNTRALALAKAIDARPPAVGDEPPPGLAAALRKPVTLDFRDANLKAVFEALSRSTGLNFVFDRDVRPDIKVTLSVRNMSIDDIVGVLTTTNQLDRKRLNENTYLIYPNLPAKQKDYADLNVRTFYLANADAKSVMAMLKTVLKTRDLYADEKLNSLTMRDTPDAIQLAEKVIAAQDFAEPEVLLDVEVLEVKRSRLSDLGIQPPGKFTVLNIVPNPSTVIATATGPTTVVNNTTTTTQLTLNQLRGLTGASIGIDNPSLNLHAENTETNILANPRIRVKNRDKARILIGDRVPVITTTSTANVGVSESVSYLDVGLKLDVEPNVFLDNEVAVKINLEVSNIVKQVTSNSGALTYQIGTRMATTTLRLRDGETQALAGLISDEDRHGTVGTPGFVDMPVLGRLFSTESKDRSKTEIVLLITPRVVRNIGNGIPSRFEYTAGTEAAVGAPQLRMHGAGPVSLSSSGPPGPVAGPTTEEPVEPDPAPAPAAATAPAPAPAASGPS